jgi:hypothetical protein
MSSQSYDKSKGIVERKGSFKLNQEIKGTLVWQSWGSSSLVNSSNSSIPFMGIVNKVTLEGEVTAITILTPVNPPETNPIGCPPAITPPNITSLSQLEFYEFSRY